MNFDPNRLALHVISVKDLPSIDSVEELLQVGTLHDIGTGLDWGREVATLNAVQTQEDVVVLEPLTNQVFFIVRPADITIH